MSATIDQDEFQRELSRLEAEFSEGDLTEKGYLKKRNELMKSYSKDLLIEQKLQSIITPTSPLSDTTSLETKEMEVIESPKKDWGATNKSQTESYISSDKASASSVKESMVGTLNLRDKKDYSNVFRNTLITRATTKLKSPSNAGSSLNQPYKGDPLELNDSNNKSTIISSLRIRSHKDSKNTCTAVYDSSGKEDNSITFEKLNNRAEKISQAIKEKRMFKKGEPIILYFEEHDFSEFIAAFYGVLYSGCSSIPFVANGQNEYQELKSIIDQSGSRLMLASDSNHRMLQKDASFKKSSHPRIELWKVSDLGSSAAKKKGLEEIISSNLSDLAYIDYEKSCFGQIRGAMFLQESIMSQVKILQQVQNVGSESVIASLLDGRTQLGLTISSFLPVFTGCQSILIPNYDNASSLLKLISKAKGYLFLI